MTLAIYSSPSDPDPTVIVDVTLESTHRRSWDYTQNPIEDGSAIADHYLSRPLELSFTGLLSTQRPHLRDKAMAESMLKREGPGPDFSSAVRDVLDFKDLTGPQLSMLEFSIRTVEREPERPYDKLGNLLDLEGQLVSVVTSEGYFDDLVITQLHTRPRGDAVEVSGELRQLQLGWTAETADVPIAKRPAKRKTKSQGKRRGKKRVGKKETPEADPAAKEKARSLLYQLIGQKRIQQAKAAIGGG